GVDFTLASGSYASLLVKATMASGAQPGNWTVRIQRVGAPAGEVRCFLNRPGEDAIAQWPAVPPGDFWILVTPRAAGPNATPEFGLTRITMAGRDLTDVTVTTAASPPVQGRLEVEGGVPLPPGIRVAALETDYEYPSSAPNTPAVPPANVGAEGAFTFP